MAMLGAVHEAAIGCVEGGTVIHAEYDPGISDVRI